MTKNDIIDFNEFCSLSVSIPVFEERKGQAWFVLDDQLCKRLNVSDVQHLLNFLRSTERDCLIYTETQIQHYISESAVYKLMLLSTSLCFDTFRDWVIRTVGPAVGSEGFFMIGEEKYYSPEQDADERDLQERDYLFLLAEEVLPEIRHTGYYVDRATRIKLKKIQSSGNPVKEMMRFLDTIKGHRSRLDLTAA